MPPSTSSNSDLPVHRHRGCRWHGSYGNPIPASPGVYPLGGANHLWHGQLPVTQRITALVRNNSLPDAEGLTGKGLASAKLDCLIDLPMNRRGASLSPASLRINSLVLFFFPAAMCDSSPSSLQRGPRLPQQSPGPVYSLGQRGKKPQSPSGLNNEEQKAPAQCRTKGHSCTGSYPESQSSPGGWVSGPLQGLL